MLSFERPNKMQRTIVERRRLGSDAVEMRIVIAP